MAAKRSWRARVSSLFGRLHVSASSWPASSLGSLGQRAEPKKSKGGGEKPFARRPETGGAVSQMGGRAGGQLESVEANKRHLGLQFGGGGPPCRPAGGGSRPSTRLMMESRGAARDSKLARPLQAPRPLSSARPEATRLLAFSRRARLQGPLRSGAHWPPCRPCQSIGLAN